MTTKSTTDGLATRRQAAAYLKVSLRTIDRLIKTGTLDSSVISRQCRRITWASIRRLHRTN